MENNKNKAYLIVHPFSNRFSQISTLEKEDYSFFRKEKKYLEKITKFISQTEEKIIITQADWCLSKLYKKLGRLCPKSLLKIIETPGDAYEGDIPRPKKGWEEIENVVEKENIEELIIVGAQLETDSGYWKLFKKYLCCIGETYNQMSEKSSAKISLDKSLCLEYPLSHDSNFLISP